MKFERIYTPGLAQVSYLVGDEQSGSAVVIDPRRDVEVYLDLANAAGLRITHVFETHVHADFVSGARELSAATGATIYAGRLGASEFPHVPLDDGATIEVGTLRFTALWTPGHTPEHIAYLLADPSGNGKPYALFSGDMLFVGEVGRPDLLGERHTGDLLSQLYDSIFERLMPLDDDIVVYPGHGAGSPCGRSIGDADSTTMGQEKRFNYAFQPRDRSEFHNAILSSMPPAPAYYPVMKRVNKQGAALLCDLPGGEPLSPAEVARRIEQGALVIDTRSAEAFGGAHIPGAFSATLSPDLNTWAGWLARYDREIVLVVEHEEHYPEALAELRRIGLDRVSGYLAGGMTAWEGEGREIATLPLISVRQLQPKLDTAEMLVLDVRSAGEWQEGHIPGALHRYAAEIVRGENGVPKDVPVAIICGSGYRSTVAASVLQRHGWDNLLNVAGGMDAWRTAGFETTTRE